MNKREKAIWNIVILISVVVLFRSPTVYGEPIHLLIQKRKVSIKH